MEAGFQQGASVGGGVRRRSNRNLEASALHLLYETAQFRRRDIFIAADHDLGILVVVRGRTDRALQSRPLNRRAVQRQREIGLQIEVKPPLAGSDCCLKRTGTVRVT
jgi:hypothetical protein